ncbi:hypothetical protein RI537_06625 [Aeromonas salmonicida]|uniref:hypothetical protein n=1 Tax=Aeromonas salmonicida TaxID=645 RepID=UPI00343E22ED
MEDFINAVTAWPIIIQGALGSGAFWLLLLIGQWLTSKAGKSTSHFLAKSRKSALINEQTRLLALKCEGHEKAHFASMLLYRMSRPLLIALICMMFGHVFSTFINVFSIIGYIGAIYYLFKALGIVNPIKYDGNIDDRVHEIQKILKEIKS